MAEPAGSKFSYIQVGSVIAAHPAGRGGRHCRAMGVLAVPSGPGRYTARPFSPEETPPMSVWSIDQARKTYSIPHWSSGYFDVDGAGRVIVRPRGSDGPSIPLPEVVDRARAQGAQLPMLVRFPDVLGDRLGALQSAFAQAQADWDYSGGYTAAYPIKVNQHRGVAGTLASHAGEGFGLEAGSKPELMAVLALSRPGGLVICNGYKDREYVRLALIGRKLGMNVFIV